MTKQYRQNGAIHRAWLLYPTVNAGGAFGYKFQLLVPKTIRFLPAGSSQLFDSTTRLYAWNTDAATSIAAGPGLMDIVATPWIIFTVLGTGAFFFIREDLHANLDASGGPDYADLFWVVNGRVEDRQS